LIQCRYVYGEAATHKDSKLLIKASTPKCLSGNESESSKTSISSNFCISSGLRRRRRAMKEVIA
jgi:hypothetical protein